MDFLFTIYRGRFEYALRPFLKLEAPSSSNARGLMGALRITDAKLDIVSNFGRD